MAIDFVVGGMAVALVVFTVVYNVIKRRRGENCCGYCDTCDGRKKKDGSCS